MAAAEGRFHRAFVTPEGIDLHLRLASAGERATAFLIDLMLIATALTVLLMLATAAFMAARGDSSQMIDSVGLLVFFALRNGYFLGFELGARGATPGKRMLGLRVVARDGGRLSGEAVVARNALRELEVVLPLTLLGYMVVASQTGDLTWLAVLVWAVAFVCFPLFNKDRLRVGDLIAGTWVVHTPRRQLRASVVSAAMIPSYTFTQAQLDAYGEYELKALEDVLRREDDLAVIVVARTIREKIGWAGTDSDDLEFLKAYYAALCARLERNMLFGKRRADKYQKV